MREVVRRGVQIDVCPECRGVWLDRGELDKLLAAEEQWENERGHHPEPPRPPYRGEERYHEPYRRQERYLDDHYYKHKKKGFLGEIFEIFD